VGWLLSFYLFFANIYQNVINITMIKIKDIVQNIVEEDIEVKNTIARGFLNLSQYAREIQKTVSKQAKKEVSVQSIALSRLQRKLKAYQYLPSVTLTQLSVRKPVIELVYAYSPENMQKLGGVASLVGKQEEAFLSLSTSSQDIVIIISEDFEEKIKKKFTKEPKIIKRNLTALSMRFPKELVEESGVGFSLMQKIASRNIVLEEVVSTFNEFTLVFESSYLPKMLDALQ
jgi:hypothetical protein